MIGDENLRPAGLDKIFVMVAAFGSRRCIQETHGIGDDGNFIFPDCFKECGIRPLVDIEQQFLPVGSHFDISGRILLISDEDGNKPLIRGLKRLPRPFPGKGENQNAAGHTRVGNFLPHLDQGSAFNIEHQEDPGPCRQIERLAKTRDPFPGDFQGEPGYFGGIPCGQWAASGGGAVETLVVEEEEIAVAAFHQIDLDHRDSLCRAGLDSGKAVLSHMLRENRPVAADHRGRVGEPLCEILGGQGVVGKEYDEEKRAGDPKEEIHREE